MNKVNPTISNHTGPSAAAPKAICMGMTAVRTAWAAVSRLALKRDLSIGAALLIAFGLHRLRARLGRPCGIGNVAAAGSNPVSATDISAGHSGIRRYRAIG